MRNSGPVVDDAGQSRALVPQARTKIGARDAQLVVVPPRPVPLRLKTRRTCARLAGYGLLAAAFAFVGYGVRDPEIRGAVDYRITLAMSSGISSVGPSRMERASLPQRLPSQVLDLFTDSRKGPRADRFAFALDSIGLARRDDRNGGDDSVRDAIARRTKTSPLMLNASYAPQSERKAALAGANLFLAALEKSDEPSAGDDAAPPPNLNGWTQLLRNASLSPDEPKKLFGGLTEGEFRERELRCMATAVYFEARDEPVKGQIAVAQVIMNRVRSPFYPKTICGVVYEGERLRRGCQFSFTCDGKRNHVNEHPEWETAVKVAKEVVAGQVWLKDVGYATHYHATYVKPEWRHELIRVTQIGDHIFYKMKPGTVQLALLREGL